SAIGTWLLSTGRDKTDAARAELPARRRVHQDPFRPRGQRAPGVPAGSRSFLGGEEKGEEGSASLVIEKSGKKWTWNLPIFQKFFCPRSGGTTAALSGMRSVQGAVGGVSADGRLPLAAWHKRPDRGRGEPASFHLPAGGRLCREM